MFAAVLIAVNPGSLYFSTLYAEPYLLFFTILIYYGLSLRNRQGNALAIGSALLLSFMDKLGVLSVVFSLSYFRQRQVGKGILLILCSLCGWIVFALYLALLTGHPFAFVQSEQAWGRSLHPPLVNFIIGIEKKDWIDVFFGVLDGYLIILYLFHSLDSLALKLFVFFDFILVLCDYPIFTPLMSILRLWGILWPVYLHAATFSQNDRRATVRYAIVVVLFASVTVIGSALVTHGHFYQ